MTNFNPIGSLLLVQAVKPAKEVDVGGIIIPGSMQEGKLKRAKVIKVGTKDIPAEIVPECIILTDYLGGEIKIDGESFYLLEAEHALAVVTE